MQNIPQRAIISAQLENLTNLRICTGKIFQIFPRVKFSQLANISNTEIIYTLKLLRTSMLSWLRTQAATEWLADYWFNTQSQLICIIIAQPNSQLWLCMFQRNRRWQGWMVGRKTTDEIGCWYTLMNSLNELRSVTFARNGQLVSWRKSSATYPVHSKSDCVIVS